MTERTFRCVITLAGRRTSDDAGASDRRLLNAVITLLEAHPGTHRIERLGDSFVLNWIVDATTSSQGLAPQCEAADWQIKPVTAGLVAVGAIEGVNWQSCRELGPRGGLGPELPVL